MNRAASRVVVVGAGMAGLTAAAYLRRSGFEVTILEKSPAVGGLVHSFTHEGFVFDTGPRAIGNAGILQPLLDDLGISLPLVPGLVSTGIADEIVHYDSPSGVADYLSSLKRLFPQASRQVDKLGRRIRSWGRVSWVLNHMPNPFFRDVWADKRFLFQQFLPLLPGFLWSVLRMALSQGTIEKVMASLSSNPSLNDMVCQHYFKATPAHFAFGYFENFRDYLYPLGGTGRLPQALAEKIVATGGRIFLDTEVVGIDLATRTVKDQRGTVYAYEALLWAADLNSLYQRVDLASLPRQAQRRAVREKDAFRALKPGESVFTLFLGVEESPDRFAALSRGHFIFTPSTQGLGARRQAPADPAELWSWAVEFCRCNSYEISIPVLKDPHLAPQGQTGLVVSLLSDGELWERVDRLGWTQKFRQTIVEAMLDTLEATVYPGLRSKLLFVESSTPLTLARRFHTSGGAITGWSMEQKSPVPHQIVGISQAPKTKIPGVYRAGQWTYSPSGVPIAILTGRVAAGAMANEVAATRPVP